MTQLQPQPGAPPVDFEANGVGLEGGVLLLEASAGTGKTFALAHLVLRLVVERQLSLRELLVVTFTDAAAAELRDRIGRRLLQALQGIADLESAAGEAAGIEGIDDVLRAWLASQGSIEASPRLRARLLLALEDLDAADITTIHGFCRRTLQRQALEAGLGPDVELDTDANTLVEQICHDYWQQQMLPLPSHLLDGLRRRGVSLKGLISLLAQLEGDAALGLAPLPSGFQAELPLPGQLINLWDQLWNAFVQLWQTRGELLYGALQAAPAHWKSLGAKTSREYPLKPKIDRHRKLSNWLIAQQAGDGMGSYADTVKDPNGLSDYFHPGPFTKQASRWEGAAVSLPERPLMEAVAGLVDGPAEAMLAHFCHWARREVAERRRRSGRMSYGDLLRGLDPGLEGTAHRELIAAVAHRYRVALIDEFQDTDPIQWRILRQAFLNPSLPGDGPDHLLVMVGDPKQAIYRFRGGDLATYQAVRQITPRVVVLRSNFRASAPLVASLNGLMAKGLARSGLEVPAVVAERSGGISLSLPAGDSPLQLLWLGGTVADAPLPSRSALERELPQQVGCLIVQLLGRGIQVREGDRCRALLPQDICLLVSRHDQAEALRQALERRGVASRLVSKEDVFLSEGAAVLQRLLDALAKPGQARSRRLLAASPLLGWSAQQIAEASPGSWDALAGQVARLSADLASRGLLAALGELIRAETLAEITLRGGLLADLQQCAELVQERMHQERFGAAAAADWLRRRRHHPPATLPEKHQPNSATVPSAVGLVTVHRSKGLEFPVVICPYLWQAPGSSRGRAGASSLGRRWTPPGEQQVRLDLHRNACWGDGLAALQQERQELGAEAERLAYVAATRAMQLLILCYGPAKEQALNPLLPWLFPTLPLPSEGDDLAPIQRRIDLEQIRGLQLITPPEAADQAERWQPPSPQGVLATGPRPERSLGDGWGRSSYSSWTHGAASSLGPIALEEGRETDGISAGISDAVAAEDLAVGPGQASRSIWAGEGPLAFFPRGAGAGDCLHRILEQVDHQLPANTPAQAELVERELARAGIEAGERDAVLRFLDQLRFTPMGGALGAFRLADLPINQRLNEMGFDLPLASGEGQLVRASGLARVFRQQPLAAAPTYADQLADLPVASRGFLTGSMDLVFTAPDSAGAERWWVADWKSNWLGERDQAGQPLACGPRHYGEESIAALMRSNHYLLQGHLYLVALHRYLDWRLPGYRASQHLGGYVYVFLRGVPGPLPRQAAEGSFVPGMLVESVDLARLESLDALLRDGQR
ncbi:UvrD-helicase domain-containing protein [Synechococcus sp. CS-1324]|uniref:UvrD-helicase domain-containing protein n=1 Tax=Synechococcus sp. CS-1324 TaxID=2847980 RepID=UPI000DB2240A|nr:UvrD-helicase domain-containing protein [Synechococcus sp. CS-1324]MCT0230187.1 UvrD-helicase domain-containing protein [Synechococcus sp. CS-1324]PZV05043.1 MAG: DNA helicase UvrD [Cyanobium sp.]